MGLNPLPSASTMMRDVMPMDQLRYHETTASWNFFILRIEMVPRADRNGLTNRMPKRMYVVD